MIRQIGLASVYVLDQDRALAFYTDQLGFELISDQTLDGFRWIEVAPPGAETGMTLAYGGMEDDWQKYVGGFAPLMFCDDLRATCAEFVSRGVEIVDGPAEYPWGLQAIIKDPDGNSIVMTERAALRATPNLP